MRKSPKKVMAAFVRALKNKQTNKKNFKIKMNYSFSSFPDSGKFSIAFVTVPTEEVAKNISHGLVKNQLAACVNIIPQVKSVYMWKGEVNEDSELILKIKTRTGLIGKLTDFVKKNHPYEVCEVISVPIDAGNPEYFKWIGETVPEKT